MENQNKYLVIIGGPSAVGKTEMAIEVAKHFNTEIVSADSRQFYKNMTIGTAIPNEKQLEQVTHHFIQHLNIEDIYNAGKYEKECLRLLQKLFKKLDVVVLTGGSGLFIHAIAEGFHKYPEAEASVKNWLNKGYDEKGISFLQQLLKEKDIDTYNDIDLNNPQRLSRALEITMSGAKKFSVYTKKNKSKRNFETIKVALDLPREELYQLINERTDKMMEDGLVEEAKQLHHQRHFNALQTVGYTELFDHFEAKYTLEEAVEKIKQHTRNYAKRQITWFANKGDYKFLPPDKDEVIKYIEEEMNAAETIKKEKENLKEEADSKD